jgi:hypothetical protein
MIFAKPKFPSLIALADIKADALTDADITAANNEISAFGITTVQLVSAAAYKEIEATLFQAQTDAEHWKGLAEKYGKQPGAMGTRAIKIGTDSNEPKNEDEANGDHLASAVSQVVLYQPKTSN